MQLSLRKKESPMISSSTAPIAANTSGTKNKGPWQFLKTLGIAFFIALALRSFIFEPFNIPSGSMIPNLLVGDFLFVSKWSYGYSRYSFPLGLDIFQGRILDFKEPTLGEVIVFKNPKEDKSIQYIKRVVGRPGDRVQFLDGVLHINGEAVTLLRIEDFIYEDEFGETHTIPQFLETMPNGTQYRILKDDNFGEGFLDNTRSFTVPEGHYFVAGDNRDHSGDSRVPEQIGYVPMENILGKAFIIYFSEIFAFWPHDIDWFSPKEWVRPEFTWWHPWTWATHLRFSRFLKLIK